MTVPPSPAALEAARVCLSHLYAENEVDTRWVALALDAFAHSSRAYAAGVVAGREEAAVVAGARLSCFDTHGEIGSTSPGSHYGDKCARCVWMINKRAKAFGRGAATKREG